MLIIAKYSEIILKGLNRITFEQRLVENIRFRLKDLGKIKITKAQAAIYIEPADDRVDIDIVVERVKKIFGIATIAKAVKCEKDIEVIRKTAVEYVSQNKPKTFKVEAKRADKNFPLKSPEICYDVGGYILTNIHDLKVDVHKPEMTLYVDVRDNFAYIYSHRIKGQGGLPLGTGGKAALLLSGGIDSPVAGYMISKRGVELIAVHFFSYPYTSERSKEKVIELANIMSQYCGKIQLNIVHFTEIQLELKKCPQDQYTLLMRRIMMRISEQIAKRNGAMALITGESIGQVASQTLPSLCVTDAVTDMLVLRPLIGMDKDEIVTLARRIGTYETSVLPYEDCCTIFVPKHPVTKPALSVIESSELDINMEELIEKAIKNIEIIAINNIRS